MLSEFLGVRQEFFQYFLVSQMHSKHRAIKSFIIDFTAILLYQFPVAFQGSVFVRFSVELIHDLNADTVHSTAEVLYDMKAVKDDFGMRKKLFSQLVVWTKHVHSDNFNAVSSLSGIAYEVVSNRGLRASIEDRDDF